MDADKQTTVGAAKLVKKIIGLIIKCFLVVLTILDFYLDILLGFSYALNGETFYASFTFLFALVPSIVSSVYTIRFFFNKRKPFTFIDKISIVLCFLLQTQFVVPIWSFVGVLENMNAVTSNRFRPTKKDERRKISNNQALFEACEALPQLSFQCYVLFGVQGYSSHLQFFSVFVSLCTGSYKLCVLLELEKLSMKIFITFINFCWILPRAIMVGVLAANLRIGFWIMIIVQPLFVAAINLASVKYMNTFTKKNWADWMKSIIFTTFVPFFMFARKGVNVIIIILFAEIISIPILTAVLGDGIWNTGVNRTIVTCNKCGNGNASFELFIDILFDSDQKIDLNFLANLMSTTLFYILSIFAMIFSFILMNRCCCRRSKPCLDIEKHNTFGKSNEAIDVVEGSKNVKFSNGIV